MRSHFRDKRCPRQECCRRVRLIGMAMTLSSDRSRNRNENLWAHHRPSADQPSQLSAQFPKFSVMTETCLTVERALLKHGYDIKCGMSSKDFSLDKPVACALAPAYWLSLSRYGQRLGAGPRSLRSQPVFAWRQRQLRSLRRHWCTDRVPGYSFACPKDTARRVNRETASARRQ